MSSLNVANYISDYVERKLSLPFRIDNDVIGTANGDAACIRHDPAPAAEQRYIDGTRSIKWNLTFYVRSSNRTKARSYAYEITDALDGVTIDADGVEISTEAATLPQFISIDDKNNTLYSAAICCTYIDAREA